MENHVRFKKGQQKAFIEKVLRFSGLSVDELAKQIKTSSRNFRNWRREKHTMTKYAAELMSKKYCVKLDEPIETLENRWRKHKSAKAKLGGIAHKIKYGSPATPEGRAKGGRRTFEILREKGIIPPTKTFNYPEKGPLLAEFIGIVLGDGGITRLQLTISLNRKADHGYIDYVMRSGETLFGERPKMLHRKNSLADNVYYNGKNLVNFLVDSGLKTGNKIRLQVDVPDWIKRDEEYSRRCCRGLIDTDGCIAIHKYRVNRKEYRYKKLIFTNHSVPLAEFVHSTLIKNGLNPKMVENLAKRRVWLYNSSEVDKYLGIVGSSNPRILKFK